MRHLGTSGESAFQSKGALFEKVLTPALQTTDDADERSMCYLLSGRHATLPGASCKLQAVLPYDSSDEQTLRTVQSNGWSGQ